MRAACLAGAALPFVRLKATLTVVKWNDSDRTEARWMRMKFAIGEWR